MKKILLFLPILVIGACATTTDEGNGLAKLTQEPKDCEYLYTLDTSMTSYDIDDAYNFMEKRILEDEGKGDSYYISEQNIRKNPEAIFGPKNTYRIKAKVYNCKK
jgi:hypothetical protein